MTPSTTFQWPLSPSGIIHPERSSPLKRVTHSSWAVVSSEGVEVIAKTKIKSEAVQSDIIIFVGLGRAFINKSFGLKLYKSHKYTFLKVVKKKGFGKKIEQKRMKKNVKQIRF